ncbi:MAG: phosphate acyltransferase PlsX [Syntrophomonadaceae bacterium]|nr:phosphate acyltransferase PlsX [Syntrophomonadaceae bacterium]
MTKAAVDAMGGDHAPAEVVAGALAWAADNADNHLLLVGKQEVIEAEIASIKEAGGFACSPEQVVIVNANEVIGCDESPATALRRKKDASIVVASALVKEGKADAVISCGSTGAQMAAAIFILGRMEGIDRPPIIASLPGEGGHRTLLVDVGANVDCKPAQLLQFALLGSVYARSVLGIASPRIGLLNNGSEETKGNALAQQVYSLLKEQEDINFIGNVEGRDLFSPIADIVVCDGFTGNILLKALEGLGLFFASSIMKEIDKPPSILESFDYSRVGGAPLLGVNGVSIVCHGSSHREAVANGLRIAEECFRNGIVARQAEELAKCEL